MAPPTTEYFIELLEEGAEAWNTWRNENIGVHPDLSEVDLSDLDLEGVNLSEINLSGADLFQTNLQNANLKMATLTGADISGAKLRGADLYKSDLSKVYLTEADLTDAYMAASNLADADLRGVQFVKANLTEADLTGANLTSANLTEANLTHAILIDANLCYANLTSTNVISVHYGAFKSMRGHYYGIRGIESSFGNALFVRDVQDQDYLDTMEHNINQTPSPFSRRLKQTFFSAWALIDYGRSLSKPLIFALILATGFGVIYFFDMSLNWGWMDYSGSAQSLLTPFYYSIVTYTTLGFGDITPKHWMGEIIVIAEVILGYTTLGLLLSILANRVARQS